MNIKTLKNFERNINKSNHIQETSSLDRHLFTRSLIENEKVTHKPPKAIRRHSSKSRKQKTSYEYIKKEDFFAKVKNDALNNKEKVSDENTLEVAYKEKNLEQDLETFNTRPSSTDVNILHELYDSLDETLINS
ncbi:hypothetical protein HHI36_024071 [Cryptolaemus montrouzieri]|uniref:Uncharacterized protein n=1 Tax=Cryptolaemus montrouzieri TaxID=559131 RepID=A0ABD2PIC6_9CUCU